MTDKKQPLTFTENAIERIKNLMAKAPEGALALRIGVDKKGCSGYVYAVEYATQQNDTDIEQTPGDQKILITAEAATILYGSEVDYVEEDLYSGFKFNNPNAKGECGCGESFHV